MKHGDQYCRRELRRWPGTHPTADAEGIEAKSKQVGARTRGGARMIVNGALRQTLKSWVQLTIHRGK
jgi:hypothetical protein